MKRTILTLGTIAAIAAPVASVVACGSSSHKDETYKGKLGDKKIKILTLGDSVAHGDYTFQMSGSGTGFTPLLDGPARAASYQDYLFDEFQRDGLMNENDKPNYRTSASGLRSGELAQWITKGTYLEGMKADNPIIGTDEEKAAAKEHVDYHRHPYAQGSDKETWWDDGLKDADGNHLDAAHAVTPDLQQDSTTMKQHILDSNVVLITIGGNDILKDIMVMGTPFPNMGSMDISSKLTGLLGGLSGSGDLAKLPHIKAVFDAIAAKLSDKDFMKTILSTFSGLGGIVKSGKIDPSAILSKLSTPLLAINNIGKLISQITPAERKAFETWFLQTGHKSLITVDHAKLDKSLELFSKNLDKISDGIHSINPNAKVIYTGYPSPLMHFPKIFRNLAMPTYGKIAELTKEHADKTEGVYYAPSSLQNWETDDVTDIYDNIMVDPHPTLEGQGAMAKDILKVINNIYDLNAKLTDKELSAKTTDIVESHEKTAPKMTDAEMQDAIVKGTYEYPYQTGDVENRGDLDYAYGVKPLPLEEVTHAKVYFGSRIATFLIDALTDSIKLNDNVKDPKDQSAPHSGALTLSELTENWGKNFLANQAAVSEGFAKLDPDFMKEVESKFKDSVSKFIETFETKIQGLVSTDPRVEKVVGLLSTLS